MYILYLAQENKEINEIPFPQVGFKNKTKALHLKRQRGTGMCTCAGEERSLGPWNEGRSEGGKQRGYFWKRTRQLLKLQRQKGLMKWYWTSSCCT